MHRLDVGDVLAGYLGDRDVEDVEVLAADQVQQQVERAFERIEDDLQRIGRDVEILRDLQHRLAKHHRQRHFMLLGSLMLFESMLRMGRGVRLWGRVGRGIDCHASSGRGAVAGVARRFAGARAVDAGVVSLA